MADDIPILAFPSQKTWETWLARNHAKSSGIWVRFFKKGSDIASVNYDEALDAALCYGWIDGQLAKADEQSWLRKFTPRRPKSVWSKRNIQHVERLTREGRMKPAGLKEVERAKADGRWGRAYDSPSNMVVPEDFMELLSKNRKARAFFDTLNKANTYAIAWRLQTAKKPETRDKRMEAIIEMLAKGETFH
ncbi:MAG TPA: YdeI/OmpD-associated family protein [Gemmatimonadota bacterium]|nr:YdeI/OmpD-associated family protein [Gemmatimonadota bacterium]